MGRAHKLRLRLEGRQLKRGNGVHSSASADGRNARNTRDGAHLSVSADESASNARGTMSPYRFRPTREHPAHAEVTSPIGLRPGGRSGRRSIESTSQASARERSSSNRHGPLTRASARVGGPRHSLRFNGFGLRLGVGDKEHATVQHLWPSGFRWGFLPRHACGYGHPLRWEATSKGTAW